MKKGRAGKFFILLILVVVGFFPTIASSRFVINRIEQSYPGLSIRAIQLGWFSSQTIEGVHLVSEEEGHEISISELRLETPLWKIFLTPLNWGKLSVVKPKVTLPLLRSEEGEDGAFSPPHIPIGSLEITEGKVELSGENGRTLQVDSIHFNVTREDGFKKFLFELTAAAYSAGERGDIRASGLVLRDDGNWSPENLEIEIARYPLETVDRFLSKPFLGEAIGPTLTLFFKLAPDFLSLEADSLHLKGSGGIGGSEKSLGITWTVPKLWIKEAPLIELVITKVGEEHVWNLRSPNSSIAEGEGLVSRDSISFHLNLSPDKFPFLAFLGKHLEVNGKTSFGQTLEMTLASPHFSVSPLLIDMKEGKFLSPFTATIAALPDPYLVTTPLLFKIEEGCWKGSLINSSLKGSFQGGIEELGAPIRLSQGEFEFEKGGGSPLHLTAKGKFSPSNQEAHLILGGDGDFLCDFDFYPYSATLWEIDPLTYRIKTPFVSTEGELYFNSENHINWPYPLAIDWEMHEEAWDMLTRDMPKLQAPALITFEWAPPEDYFSIEHPSTWRFQATASSPQIAFASFPFTHLFSSLDINGKKGKLLLTFEGETSDQRAFGKTFSGEALLSDWVKGETLNFEKALVTAKLALSQFPSKLLPNPSQELEELLGHSLSLDLGMTGSMKEAIGSLKIEAEHLKGALHWEYRNHVLYFSSLSSPSLELRVTPELFDLLSKDSLYVPKEPIPLLLELDSLTLRIPEPFSTVRLLMEAQGKGSFKISPSIFSSRDQSTSFSLPSLGTSWNLSEGKGGRSLNIGTEEKGFLVDLVWSRRSSLPSEVSIRDLNIRGHLYGREVPAPLLSFIPEMSRLEPLFNPSFSADLSIVVQEGRGVVSGELSSPQANLVAQGKIEDGWFFLTKPLEAVFEMNPEIAKGLVGDLVPLVSTGLRGRSPIQVKIDPKNFRLPLAPFDLKQFEVGKGAVYLDQIEVEPNHQLNDLLSILSLKNNSAGLEKIWFTPLYFSMNEGVVKIERVDFLVSEKFPLSLWGRADFLKDRVDMKIGLSGKALESAFRLKGVPQDYILPIPLSGPLSAPFIDKPRATAQITSFLATLKGRKEGSFIGGVVDLLSAGLGEEEIPPPTTQPLPWESKESKSSPSLPAISPVGQALKGAKSILKKLH